VPIASASSLDASGASVGSTDESVTGDRGIMPMPPGLMTAVTIRPVTTAPAAMIVNLRSPPDEARGRPTALPRESWPLDVVLACASSIIYRQSSQTLHISP
jgi:hypothetical protein